MSETLIILFMQGEELPHRLRLVDQAGGTILASAGITLEGAIIRLVSVSKNALKAKLTRYEAVVEAARKATLQKYERGRKDFRCSHCGKTTPLLLDVIAEGLEELKQALE